MFLLSAFDADAQRPRFHIEALLSAFSLRQVTGQPIRLVSNSDGLADRVRRLAWCPFDEIIVETEAGRVHPKAQKLAAMRGMAGDFVFLDTDTVVLDDISRVFEMGTFDVAGVSAPWREDIVDIDTAVRRERKRSFQLNSGVLFLRCARVDRLLAAWEEDFLARIPDFADRPDDIRDQVSFQNACETLRPDMFRLPPNYNFRTSMGGFLSGGCFVLHGHMNTGLEELSEDFDKPAFLEEVVANCRRINDTTRGTVFPALRSTTPLAPGTFVRGRRIQVVEAAGALS